MTVSQQTRVVEAFWPHKLDVRSAKLSSPKQILLRLVSWLTGDTCKQFTTHFQSHYSSHSGGFLPHLSNKLNKLQLFSLSLWFFILFHFNIHLAIFNKRNFQEIFHTTIVHYPSMSKEGVTEVSTEKFSKILSYKLDNVEFAGHHKQGGAHKA